MWQVKAWKKVQYLPQTKNLTVLTIASSAIDTVVGLSSTPAIPGWCLYFYKVVLQLADDHFPVMFTPSDHFIDQYTVFFRVFGELVFYQRRYIRIDRAGDQFIIF